MDETDRENPFIEQESENVWVVDGRFPVEDAAELGWPVEDSADYETIAGWLMSMLDSVPQVGEELAFDGYRFKIQAMRRRRISTVRGGTTGRSLPIMRGRCRGDRPEEA